MIRLLLAVALISTVFSIEPAQAKLVRAPMFRGCDECPFPMHEWAGNWWNQGAGLKLEIRRFPGSSRMVRVFLRDIETRHIVAEGLGKAPLDSDTMRIEMERNDGIKFTTFFTLDPKMNRVHALIPTWIGGTLNGQEVPSSSFFVD